MKKICLVLLSSIIFYLPFNNSAMASYSGDYICENDHMTGSFSLDDQRQSHFLAIRIEIKKNGTVNEYSGSVSKTSLGDRNLTVFGLDNHRLLFNADNTVTYNGSIACSKK